MATYQEIDTKIQNGYTKLENKDSIQGCEDWFSAWEDICQIKNHHHPLKGAPL